MSRLRAIVTANPLFNLAVAINLALCTATLIVMIWAATDSTNPPPAMREKLFNVCEKVFTLTAGAFIGLLGGRAAAPDRVVADEEGGTGT